MARIIIIDDDPDLLETVSRVLHSDHHDVTVAVNGSQGVQLIKSRPFDLILCDIGMPQVDGYSVFQLIKNDSHTSAVPFVFVTARAARTDQRKGMELGADDYLVKPFSAKELLSCVRTQIVKHHLITDHYETTLRMVRKNIMYALPHELRTPLTQIMGYAGLLEMDQEQNLPVFAKDYGRRITQASERLAHLIENYLVYAQIEIVASSPEEQEKLRNHVVPDVAPLIEKNICDRAQRHKREDDLKFTIAACTLRISENDLTKIICELVDNAFKFSSPGQPVAVDSTKVDHVYQITVSDQGHGMNTNQIALLDAYMQFERTFYEQQGVGLGFVIAKRLIELYGGTIKVESKIGSGTTVRITFPV